MESYAITSITLHPNYKPTYENELEMEILKMNGQEFFEALELILSSINNQLITGCDLVDDQTGEIFLTFQNSSPIPTYNGTDLTF